MLYQEKWRGIDLSIKLLVADSKMTIPAARLLIQNACLFTPNHPGLKGWLLVENGLIRVLGFGDTPNLSDNASLQSLDAQGDMLLPGFIDTTWTASRPSIMKALQLVKQTQGQIQGGATLLGAHLEGPYLNPARCGAQNVNLIRRAEKEEALEFLETGVIRLLALAPEFEENLWLIDECVRRGITVSAAHTTASYEQMQRAVEHGVTHVTHCFNAMSGLGHRELGTVGAAMSLAQLSCELIADNIHVHPAAQKILVNVKNPSGVILVTDAIRATGLPDGEYMLDERSIHIKNGAVRLPDGTLAGSVLTMERALQNVCAATGRLPTEMWVASSLNAARAIGVSSHKGSLE